MNMSEIHTLDLNFQGIPRTIAAYLLPHSDGAALVECGPGSTIPCLLKNLDELGYSINQITHVFLTHIHLDHAGAAGWLARQGANIYVHAVGAPHLANPEKLLASASRLYGERMDQLWGEFLPVPENQLFVLQDNEVVEFGKSFIRAIATPGHASHHHAFIYEDTCFTGDIGGVRMPNKKHIRLPMPPPEFNPELWQASVQRLRQETFSRLAPTHFGIFTDPDWHLAEIEKELERTEAWMKSVMPADPPIDVLRDQFTLWERSTSLQEGIDATTIHEYDVANPSYMSADGIQRYWKKFRLAVN